MQDPETRYARGKEGAVAYQVLGDGPLDVVFIPNWVSNVDAMWEEPSIQTFKRAVAGLIPLKNVDRESLAMSTHPEFLALVKKARAEIGAGRSLSLDEMRARVLPRKKASNPRLQRTADAPPLNRQPLDGREGNP